MMTPASANTERPHAKPAEPVEVPAGTQLAVALSSDLSTKTARPGDAFEAHLVSDLVIGDRRVAPAGSRLTGTVTGSCCSQEQSCRARTGDPY